MATVQDIEKCKVCNGVMFTEFNTRSMEEFNHCNRCGYTHNVLLDLDDEGNVRKDENGKWMFKLDVRQGYGVYAITHESGFGEIGTFNEPITEETIAELQEIFSKPEIDANKSYLIRFEDNKMEVLLGSIEGNNMLLDFDELMKKHEQEAGLAEKSEPSFF